MMTQRILHTEEKQYLSPEAQEVAYRYFLTEQIPLEITEKAILQAFVLSNFGSREISGELFQQIVNANIQEHVEQSSGAYVPESKIAEYQVY